MTITYTNSAWGAPIFASELDRVRYELQQANAALERTRQKPQLIGTVGCVLPGQRAIVYFMQFAFAIKVPDKCESGMQVTIAAESNSILDVLPDHVSFGPVVTVSGITGHDILCDQGMNKASAFLPSSVKARVGEKVQLDPTGNVVLRNVDNDEPTDYVVRKSPGVSWDDIGGHEEAKEALREAIEYPVKFANVYKAHGQTPTRGALLFGAPGCVDGDAEVTINRAGRGFKLTLRDLVARFNAPGGVFRAEQHRAGWNHADGGGRCVRCKQLWPCSKQRRRDATPGGKTCIWDPNIPTTIRCLHNGEFRLRRITAAYAKGVKPVLKLTLGDGKTIRVTGDHEIARPGSGWTRADALKIGEIVLTNGAAASVEENDSGRHLYKGYWVRTSGLQKHPNARNRKNGGAQMFEHRLVAEAKLNGLTLEQWLEVIRVGRFDSRHAFIPEDMDVHHDDRDPTNNAPDNLIIKTKAEHLREHAVEDSWHLHIPIFLPKENPVVSIEPDGEAEVFDITVEEAHNFVANGIVVHNCGKTMLGKAVATAMAVDGDGSGFIYVKAAEVLNRFVGASEAAIRGLFARARAHKEKTGNPAVIFIDEADALLGSREGHGLTMAITQTVVPMFLAEMDGLEDSGAFVILSTNRPDSLDPAILRDGRMDVHVHIDRPDIESTNKIFARALRGRKLMASSQDDLVANAVRMLHSDSASLYELHFQSGGTELVRLRDGLSGAMIAGIVKAAAGAAIRRDRVSGEITGITGDDIEQAIRGKYNQFLSAKRSDLIQEKCDALGGARPIRIEKRPGRLD